MRVSCALTFIYPSEKIARTVKEATTVDDEGFVSSSVKKNQLLATIEADSVSSLLHTLDDYLSCVSVAENVVDKS